MDISLKEEAEKKGLAIKQYRIKKKWSQSELAKFSQLSQVSISKIESGKVIPSGKTIFKLCKALGITESELLSNSFQSELRPKTPLELKITEIITRVLQLQKDV